MYLTVNDQPESQCMKTGQYAPQEPTVALPFCCMLISVRPTPFPPMSHLSHFASYQPTHLINPKVASSEAGGTPPDTPEQQNYRAPPPPSGGGGTLSDTVEQPCGGKSVSDISAEIQPADTPLIHTTYPVDASSYDLAFSPAASTAIHILSSSATASSTVFFASDLDSTIPKANFLAFRIASPTGKSFVLTRECLMEPQRHRLCSIFPVECSW